MILVLGGTKTGKSSFASDKAMSRGHLGKTVYLATAEARDEEIRQRIKIHQAERPAHWLTAEEPTDPAGYFLRLAEGKSGSNSPGGDSPATVLLDCITMWLTNLLMPFGEEPNRVEALETGRREISRLIDAIAIWEQGSSGGSANPSLEEDESASADTLPRPREAIIVSNQVEVGLISPWPLGRIFQDLAGLSHQTLASAADEVYLMNAGLPLKIK